MQSSKQFVPVRLAERLSVPSGTPDNSPPIHWWGHYIENQAEHHHKKTFKEELESLLKKHAMEYEDWMLD